MKEVYINRLSRFLPNRPIENDEMESYLGLINNTPSRSRSIVLRNNGIKARYYSFDKEGKSTHSNAQMTANAINALFDDGFLLENVDLLACGSTSPDQLLPSHGSMVHGLLEAKPMEVLTPSGSCCTGVQSLLFAWMNIMSGRKKLAIAAGSEKLSQLILAKHFQPESDHHIRIQEDPMIAFEKDFLRWMLSDGAGAALLSPSPNEHSCSLKIEWVESCSFANELETCMWGGAIKEPNGDIVGWGVLEPKRWLEESVFPLKQDVKLLGQNIVPIGGRMLKELCSQKNFNVSEISWFLPHLSSAFFKEKIYQELKSLEMEITWEKWFTNLSEVGNIGSASIFVMLEELVRSDRVKAGQKILCMVPESARFSYAYVLLTVV